MKFTDRLTAAVMSSVIIVVQALPAKALEESAINEIAKQITVRIDGANQGTGVIVNKQGTIYTVLTNYHVVQIPGKYSLKTPDNKTYSFNSDQAKKLPNLDLAVVEFNSNENYNVAKLGDSSKLTETTAIFTAGWIVPDAFCLARCYRFSEGKILSISPKSKDGYVLIYSNPVKKGMSGGPVLNKDGELVGINGNSFTDPETGVSDFAGIPINEYKKYQNIATTPQRTPTPTPLRPTPQPKPSPSPNINNNTPTNSTLVQTLTGHSNSVLSVAISPDGRTLASGSGDNTIKIWNLATGKQIRTLSGHFGSVLSIAISPNGKTLVSGGQDNTIKIWNLATGEEIIRRLSGIYGQVSYLAISPDGGTLVSGSGGLNNIIKIWNLATGEEIIRTFSFSSSVAIISPDGRTLVSSGDDKTIKLWNLSTGELIRTLSSYFESVFSLAISPDGRTLVSGDDKTIKLWNLSTGELIRTLSGHSGSVLSVAISPDGKTLASGSDDKTIKLWNLATGELIRTLSDHSEGVSSVAFSPDSGTLATGSFDNTIKIWRVSGR